MSALTRGLVAVLALILATAGLPPCAGMNVSRPSVRAEHHCCGGTECVDRESGSDAVRLVQTRADCCRVSQVPDARPPVERRAQVASAGPLESAPYVVQARPAVTTRVDLRGAGPPLDAAAARHLLFSVFLI